MEELVYRLVGTESISGGKKNLSLFPGSSRP
jgi:hypothetical protein